MQSDPSLPIRLSPIGYLKAKAQIKHQLPSQTFNCDEKRESSWQEKAQIELLPGYGFEQALEGLDGFNFIWILSWMHRAQKPIASPYYNDKAKVNPPGLGRKVGVLATRSPHHPNPIGLSRVRLMQIKGRFLTLEGCDLLDGTPIFDLKPYIVSVDSEPEAACGWVDERRIREAEKKWQIIYSDAVNRALVALQEERYLQKVYIERALRFGLTSSSSNRIKKKEAEKYELALGPWRVQISFDIASHMLIERIYSGYRSAEEIADPFERTLHQPWINHSIP